MKRRRWKEPENVDAWFAGRLPDDWFTEAPEIRVDRDEIFVIGRLVQPTLEEDATDEDRSAADHSRIEGWREETRRARINIARQAENTFGLNVSWGARCGEEGLAFTTVAAPAMTRLRMSERRVLDTLIDAGVARSRSEALAWCVRLVGEHEDEWLSDLRDAIDKVHEVRGKGPGA